MTLPYREKEKVEVGQLLKEEKQKLKTLNEFLEKCTTLSSKTKESSAKSQVFLKKFSEELEPILKKSYELKNNVQSIDQALTNAKSKLEYIQNARALERRLSQKVQKSDIRLFTDAMDKAMVIFEFTKNDKHSNEYHAEINDKMEKALEFAIQQLATLFAETVRDIMQNNQKDDLNVLMQIDQYFNKLGMFDHLDTYIRLKERDFTKKIKELIAVSDLTSEEAYRKESSPLVSSVSLFITHLKQGKSEIAKIFSSSDANEVFHGLANHYEKAFIDLIDILLGPKNMFTSNYQFFVSLDFAEKLLTSSEELKSSLGSYSFSIEAIFDKFNVGFRAFIKNYSRVMIEGNKRPENEQISHITYKAIVLVTQLQDYHKILSYLSIETEISSAILKSVVKLLEENRSYFKSKNQILPILYLLNNFFYMISKTTQDESEAVIDFTTREVLDELFERHIIEYLTIVWGDENGMLNMNIEVSQEKNGKLKASTRKAIKKQFADFNHRVQDFQKLHKEVWFVSKEFTETLKRKNKKHVLAKYQAFFNKFGELSFTKNRDKYLKYTLAQLSEAIDDTLRYSYASAVQAK